MTIVIEKHPVLDAVVVSGGLTFFIGVSAVLIVVAIRSPRSPGDRRGERIKTAAAGVAGLLLFGGFAAAWWLHWPPRAVELTADAVELRYLWSTERVRYDARDRVEFEVHESRYRGPRETFVVRLRSAGRTHEVSVGAKPRGHPDLQPVRELFDQLARRVPPEVVCSDSVAR